LQAPYNNLQSQPANFWKGEIAYRNGNIDDAVGYFTVYLKNPQINGDANPVNEVRSRIKKYNFLIIVVFLF